MCLFTYKPLLKQTPKSGAVGGQWRRCEGVNEIMSNELSLSSSSENLLLLFFQLEIWTCT